MANIHTPERTEGESFAAYKARRSESNKHAARIARGTRLANHLTSATTTKTLRRDAVKALGLRQMKRERYLVKHPEYAAKHPTIADRYAF